MLTHREIGNIFTYRSGSSVPEKRLNLSSQKMKFNTFEDFLVPDRRTWVIKWNNSQDDTSGACELVIKGKYIARNVTGKGGQIKAKPNQIASVWLYAGTTVGFSNQAVVDSAKLEVYADTVKPPFKLPDWFTPIAGVLLIILIVVWIVQDALTENTHEHWENAAEELKRSESR